MEELKKDYTVIVVTHNMQQAARVADMTAFFLLGEIIELQGTGEGRAFTLNEQQELVRLCAKGNRELLKIQKEALGGKL